MPPSAPSEAFGGSAAAEALTSAGLTRWEREGEEPSPTTDEIAAVSLAEEASLFWEVKGVKARARCMCKEGLGARRGGAISRDRP